MEERYMRLILRSNDVIICAEKLEFENLAIMKDK